MIDLRNDILNQKIYPASTIALLMHENTYRYDIIYYLNFSKHYFTPIDIP